MDQSAPAAQDVQTQTTATQSGDAAVPAQTAKSNADLSSDDQSQSLPTQQPAAQKIPTQQPPKKQQISISGGGLEEGASVMIEDDSDADDEEDEIQVAPQEKKNLGVMGQGGDAEEQDEQQVASPQGVANLQTESVEIAPAIPEVVTSSPEVEKLVEITPPDKPKLNEEMKKIGVTHSGPGIIDPGPSKLPEPKMPITIEEVLQEEEKIKSNRLHTSKFWLLEKIKYIWRKVNPKIVTDLKKQQEKPAIAAETQQVETETVTEQPVPVINKTTEE